MGLLDRHRDKKAERERRHEIQAQTRAAAAKAAKEDFGRRNRLQDARTNPGTRSGVALMLKNDERVFQELAGLSLIEPRCLPGAWEGRSQGFSAPAAGGVHYRAGASRGRYVQDAETPASIDSGTVTITDQRVVFQGAHATREWAFTEMLGLQHAHGRQPWTAIEVSNRDMTSGFTYPAVLGGQMRFRLDLAIAHFNGELDSFIAGLEAELHEHTLT